MPPCTPNLSIGYTLSSSPTVLRSSLKMMHLTTRRSLARLLVTAPVKSRAFHATSPALVSVSDRIPDLDLVEDSPGNKVNLSKELAQGKGVIIGVPAAFSKPS